jgi:hypothetical protein
MGFFVGSGDKLSFQGHKFVFFLLEDLQRRRVFSSKQFFGKNAICLP